MDTDKFFLSSNFSKTNSSCQRFLKGQNLLAKTNSSSYSHDTFTTHNTLKYTSQSTALDIRFYLSSCHVKPFFLMLCTNASIVYSTCPYLKPNYLGVISWSWRTVWRMTPRPICLQFQHGILSRFWQWLTFLDVSSVVNSMSIPISRVPLSPFLISHPHPLPTYESPRVMTF